MLSNYNIIKILGQGGMGKVYLAIHKTINRQVAIKELLAEYTQNDQLRQRFRQEATLLATLDHPAIVRLYDFVEMPDKLYLVMEFSEGTPLSHIQHKFSVEEINIFFPKILQAIDYAHQQHIIHRDLKPANILLDANYDIKILDFGIAKLLHTEENQLTRTGTRIGTIYYMSPEQIKGNFISCQSDIYALGVMLFELLIGYNPYENITSDYDISHKILHEPLPLLKKINPNISDFFQRMIFKATAKNPKQRYQNISEWLEDWKIWENFYEKNKHQIINQIQDNEQSTLADVIGEKKSNSNVELVIYTNDNFEKIQKNTNNKNNIIENLNQKEEILFENVFGNISNKSLHFYQHKDLFEQGILTKIDLVDVQKIEISTQREVGSGIFLFCISIPFLWFSIYLFTIIFFLLFFVLGLICFLEFPLITIYMINGKKIKMKGWFYEYKEARNFVKKIKMVLSN